jgi:hypothetical protein
MAGHHSHDIFRIIHSLTKGEWSTLIDEVAKSQSIPGGKGRLPKYLALIKHLKAEDSYDDSKAKIDLGYGERKNADWRTLKREAINHILQAIERARSNQTKRTILQKIPTEINKLIEKGLWEKADRKTATAIEDTENLELYEVQTQLLNLKQFIVTNSYPAEDAIDELQSLQSDRNIARSKLQNIEKYQGIWFEITSSAKLQDKKTVQKIFNSRPVQVPELLSTRATILFLQIQRRASFVLGLREVHIKSINDGIEFCLPHLSNPEAHEILLLFAKLVFEKGREALRNGDIAGVGDTLRQLENVMQEQSIPPFVLAAVQERILLLKLLNARIALEKTKLLAAVQEINDWIKRQKGYLNEDTFHRIAIACIDGLIFCGEYSRAIKWLLKIRRPKKSAFHPQISSVSWLIYLAIRYEQEEWDIIQSQISGTRSYLKKYEPDNEYLWTLFKFFEMVAKVKAPVSEKEWKTLSLLLQKLSKKTQYSMLGNHFDFLAWIQSNLDGKPFSPFLPH